MATTPSLAPVPRPFRTPGVIEATQGGRTVLLDIHRGRYYALDGVAARIWQLLERPSAVDDIVETIAAEYHAPTPVIDCDVRAFLCRLNAARLVVWQ